jgi:hypothetical protein
MGNKGKLLLTERVIPQNNEPFFGKLLDIQMLLISPGARERTLEEYRALLKAGGFQFNRLIPTASPTSIIESVPI